MGTTAHFYDLQWSPSLLEANCKRPPSVYSISLAAPMKVEYLFPWQRRTERDAELKKIVAPRFVQKNKAMQAPMWPLHWEFVSVQLEGTVLGRLHCSAWMISNTNDQVSKCVTDMCFLPEKALQGASRRPVGCQICNYGLFNHQYIDRTAIRGFFGFNLTILRCLHPKIGCWIWFLSTLTIEPDGSLSWFWFGVCERFVCLGDYYNPWTVKPSHPIVLRRFHKRVHRCW